MTSEQRMGRAKAEVGLRLGTVIPGLMIPRALPNLPGGGSGVSKHQLLAPLVLHQSLALWGLRPLPLAS